LKTSYLHEMAAFLLTNIKFAYCKKWGVAVEFYSSTGVWCGCGIYLRHLIVCSHTRYCFSS